MSETWSDGLEIQLLSEEKHINDQDVPSDLDIFFTQVYHYFLERGFINIVSSRTTNLITIGFTIILSTFLLLLVDWSLIINEYKMVIRTDLFQKHFFWDSLLTIYFIIFSIYFLWNLVSFIFAIKSGLEMKNFFNTEELQFIEWSNVIDTIVKLQNTGYKLCIVKDLTALDITNRIMRKENFLIAIANLGLIELRLWPYGDSTHTIMLSKVLEWNIRMAILYSLFDNEFTIRHNFVENANILRRRFYLLGIFNLFLMPFNFIFMIIFFFLKYTEEFHSKSTYLGPREWTPLAKWKLRDYNELPHFFTNRLDTSTPIADKYITLYPNRSMSHWARAGAFICGALVAVLLLFTIIDSKILMNLQLGSRNLLWYLTLFVALAAMMRSLIYSDPVDESIDTVIKLIIFFYEMLSVIVTPWMLLVSLPTCSEKIVNFLSTYTVHHPGVGDICGFGMFDFEKFGHPSLNSQTLSSQQISNSLTIPNYFPQLPSQSNQAKMEKSFLTFVINNPSYTTNEHGSSLLNSLLASQSRLSRVNSDQNIAFSHNKSLITDTDHETKRESSPTNHPNPRNLLTYSQSPFKDLSESDVALTCSFSQLLKAKPSNNTITSSKMASLSQVFSTLDMIVEEASS